MDTYVLLCKCIFLKTWNDTDKHTTEITFMKKGTDQDWEDGSKITLALYEKL